MGKSCLVCCLLMILLFFVSLLNIKVGTLPSTYLGLPLGAPFRSVLVWDGLEERFRRRLFLWK